MEAINGQPEWAKAAIIAEYVIDDCNSQTDYFGAKTGSRVFLAWSKHERDLFAEMRKAAATLPETRDLATAPAGAEHREKYSMGGGFYLKAGDRYSTGWKVRKVSLRHYGSTVAQIIEATARTAEVVAIA